VTLAVGVAERPRGAPGQRRARAAGRDLRPQRPPRRAPVRWCWSGCSPAAAYPVPPTSTRQPEASSSIDRRRHDHPAL